MRMANRLAGMGVEKYIGTTRKTRDGKVVWNGEIHEADSGTINWPLRARTPRLIFVNSMSDLGHEKVDPETFLRILTVMIAADWHIFQVLTKRPEVVLERLRQTGIKRLPPHIWIGVSVGIPEAKSRIDTLRRIPAALRFISAEPLIEPLGRLNLRDIDWVIIGGESGPRSVLRPVEESWVTSVVGQCVEAGSAVYLKQWGVWQNNPLFRRHGLREAIRIEAEIAGRPRPLAENKGGCSLDGRLWVELPEAGAALLGRRKAAATVADRMAELV
jgi:protein gp37